MRYIGSKNLLLEEIESLLTKHTLGNEKTFLDLFGGTNVVGRYFKDQYTIYSNDLLYFSFVNAKATIENNKPLSFSKLKKAGINNPFQYLEDDNNAKNHINSYYMDNYTPAGDAMYFTEENGKRIDFIRDTIDVWRDNNLLTKPEYYYLISCLIEAIPFVSNTTGTYGAFLKHWDKRALKPLELQPLRVLNNYANNKAFNEDSNELVKSVQTDITYIDTPYNTRQYASNYHVLENIAKNDKPELKGKTRLFDWSSLKSDYSTKKNAYNAMKDLIENVNSTHIVVSYNDEGIIPIDELTNLLKNNSCNDKVDIVEVDYQKYNSKIKPKKNGVTEYLIYINKDPITKANTSKTVKKTSKWAPKKEKYIKSPLNYIGGKYKLLEQIIPLFPNDINIFLDLFSGGANVGINVKANKYIFNDMNYKINEVFRYFSSNNSHEVIKRIENRIKEYNLSKTNKEGYLKFRKDYNNNPNPLDLYTLVCFSYNYQFRFNNSLEFNNPFGKNRSSFSENMRKNLIRFSDKLDTIEHKFTDKYFTDIDYSFLTEEDFVYLDPPYSITNGSYNDGNRGFKDWDKEQELAMYELMDYLTDRNIRFALSNVLEHKGITNNMLLDYIKGKPYYVHDLNYSYRNSSHNTKKEDSQEVLITNYDPVDFEVQFNKNPEDFEVLSNK